MDEDHRGERTRAFGHTRVEAQALAAGLAVFDVGLKGGRRDRGAGGKQEEGEESEVHGRTAGASGKRKI
jgi:hypothetical protein